MVPITRSMHARTIHLYWVYQNKILALFPPWGQRQRMECRDENNLRLLRSTAGFLHKLQRVCCRAAILVSGRLLLPRIYAFTVVDAHSILHDFFFIWPGVALFLSRPTNVNFLWQLHWFVGVEKKKKPFRDSPNVPLWFYRLSCRGADARGRCFIECVIFESFCIICNFQFINKFIICWRGGYEKIVYTLDSWSISPDFYMFCEGAF